MWEFLPVVLFGGQGREGTCGGSGVWAWGQFQVRLQDALRLSFLLVTGDVPAALPSSLQTLPARQEGDPVRRAHGT